MPRSWILTGSPENYAATPSCDFKWPAEHWTLALQGQIRAVSDRDAEILLHRLTAAVGARA